MVLLELLILIWLVSHKILREVIQVLLVMGQHLYKLVLVQTLTKRLYMQNLNRLMEQMLLRLVHDKLELMLHEEHFKHGSLQLVQMDSEYS